MSGLISGFAAWVNGATESHSIPRERMETGEGLFRSAEAGKEKLSGFPTKTVVATLTATGMQRRHKERN
jgi:hypothetical protein